MPYVIAPSAPVSLPLVGSDDRFPVRRVYCVGRNYAEHSREMGGDPSREAPFFFQKNPDNIVLDGRFPYPPQSHDVHHEVELVVALAAGGRDIPAAAALDHVFGYAVGIDMTRRDLQGQAKREGRPWAMAKAFEHSAPMSALRPAEVIGHPTAGRIWLEVDGVVRQRGDLAEMVWSVPEIIAALSALVSLAPGDLIMTGTPAGVGAVARGQVMRAGIDGIGELGVRVV